MNWILYIFFSVIVAILYTKYYLKSRDYQMQFQGLQHKKWQVLTVVFISALVIAPFIVIIGLYERITY